MPDDVHVRSIGQLDFCFWTSLHLVFHVCPVSVCMIRVDTLVYWPPVSMVVLPTCCKSCA